MATTGDLSIALDPVGQTAAAALRLRAKEQDHDPPLLHDPLARDWLTPLHQHGFADLPATRVAVCHRARLIDGCVRQWSAQHPGGVAVELGVGFSTRFDRFNQLPITLVGVDRDEIVRHRDPLLLPGQPRSVVADLPDPTLTEKLRDAVGPRPVCFIAEGLFMYLDADAVRQTVEQLAEGFPHAALWFDAYRPAAKLLSPWHESLRRLNVSIHSTHRPMPRLRVLRSHTLRSDREAFARLPWPYRLPGVHRLHATHEAKLI